MTEEIKKEETVNETAGTVEETAEQNEAAQEVQTEPDDLSAVRDALAAKGYEFMSAEIEKIPSSYIKLENEDDIRYMNLLLEHLDDNEDVQNVWHNWEE